MLLHIQFRITKINKTIATSKEGQEETGFQSYENEYLQLQNEELSSPLKFDFDKFLSQQAVKQISQTAGNLGLDVELAIKLYDQCIFPKTVTLSFSSFISQGPSNMSRKA